MFKLVLLSLAFAFSGAGYAHAQDSSVDSFHQDRTGVINKYHEQVRGIQQDLKGQAQKLSEIVQCYQSGHLWDSTGCQPGPVHDPESDPHKSNHANNTIDTTCASNETIEFSGGSWSCKEVRYKCSNSLGC